MGSGKTSVGRPVADALGRPFLDNDDGLLARTGSDARAYERAHGRARLHEQELAVLRSALDSPTPSVITAAASVVDTEAGRRLLREGAVVAWVDADPAVLAERVAGDGDDHRPAGTDEASLAAQRADRHDHFVEVAAVMLRTDQPGSAADELVHWSERMGLGAGG
jgi:shikimate kinase